MEKPLLSLKNASKKFYRSSIKTKALENINLVIPQGSIYGVIGKNGSGKSTLFRCILGLEKLDEGSILLEERKIPYDSPSQLRQVRKNIGVVFQQLHLFSSRTVEENISYPLEIQGTPLKEKNSRVDEILSLMQLQEKRKNYPKQLSGGEKQRVAIGRAIVNHPKILLCDEATAALDTQTQNSIAQVLKKLNTQLGITIVIIAHQYKLVKQLCTHIAFLKNGHIEKQGPKQWLFSENTNQDPSDLDTFINEFIEENYHV